MPASSTGRQVDVIADFINAIGPFETLCDVGYCVAVEA